MSLRGHLVALVVATLLPVLLFSGVVVVLLAREQQANVERGLRDTTRALALAVEERILGVASTLEALAVSDTLDDRRLGAFHAEARGVVPLEEGWLLVGVADISGRQLLNTAHAFGTPLPPIGDAGPFREVVATGRPAVSDLQGGRVSTRPTIVVAVPARRGGQLRYVVFAAIDPQSFTRILEAQRIATEWTGAILDRDRVIMARSRDAEAMIGRPATGGLALATQEVPEGAFWDVTQEGRPAYGAFSRVPGIGWTVVLGVPAETVTVASQRALWLVVLGGVALLVVAVLLAALVGRRIARPIAALAEAAAALGRGEPPRVADHAVEEVDRVAREIEAAATERRRAERRVAFLAEASRVLASSLDYQTTFQSVATLAAGELAEICVVDLLEPDGAIRRVAAAHADPARAGLAERLRSYPPEPPRQHPVLEVLRTGRPMRLDDLTPDRYEAIARDVTHLEIMRALGVVSVLLVPLVARGRTLGVLWLASCRSAGADGPADLALAEDLGRRAGVALDNARLVHEAQEAVRVRDAFLARASHELRTPLTSAVATLRLLERSMSGRVGASPAELLEIAGRNLDAMLSLINNLLDASKLTAGEESLSLEPVDLAYLVQLTLDVVGMQARDRGVEVVQTVRPGAQVQGDRLKLEQVLVNLVANAVKFTPTGGRVSVEVGPDPGDGLGAEIRVQDTGTGIAAEHLERVFEPFFQAGAAGGGGRVRGTGLGLAICRQIVSLHGGRIWAESEGPGRGSTFVVRLPGTPRSARAA